MLSNDEIIIKFTLQQQQEIAEKCGLGLAPIVTNSLSLVMLSMAATAFKSESLPLVKSITTVREILNQVKNGSNTNRLYTLTVSLSPKQREIIKNAVNKEWFNITILPDEYDVSFEQNWDDNLTIQHIGKSIVILPENVEYNASLSDIVIKLPDTDEESKNSFGTGSHPTTKATLILLEKHLKAGKSLLDVGTGSGILAIAAAKLGATNILGIDIDSGSILTAHKTVKLNNLENLIQIKEGSIESVENQYEIIIANLFPKIIISMIESFSEKITKNGLLIVSGIVSVRMAEIISVLEAVGFEHLESEVNENWCGIAFRKS